MRALRGQPHSRRYRDPAKGTLRGHQYRDPAKRAAYLSYAEDSRVLTESLKAGDITQAEFDAKHDELDRRYAWVR